MIFFSSFFPYSIPNLCGYMDYNTHIKGLNGNTVYKKIYTIFVFDDLIYFMQDDFWSPIHLHENFIILFFV